MQTTLKEMIEDLARHPEIRDARVIKAMAMVNREDFVPEHLRHLAYSNSALPLAHEATISQPYIVAFMTMSACIEPGHRVLEIGTGSGYQAAVLAAMGAEVFTVEFVEELAHSASSLLSTLGYEKVRVRCGNGRLGWQEEAPFDAVLVTAASEDIPPALVNQLREGGRLVIPVGDDSQLLKVLLKTAEGLEAEALVPVRFVRLRK